MEPEPSHEENPTPGGRFERATLFLKQVRDELKRVTWPSRREVRATTVVVLVMTFAMGMYLWGLDLLLDRFMVWIIQRFGIAS
jgi:preprotein translocase subunit SecE